MNGLNVLTALLLGSVAISATANNISSTAPQCVFSEKRCTIDIVLPAGVVSWYITSQAAGNPGLIIRYKDDREVWQEVVKTTVHSTDLSNKSFGDFVIDQKRKYELIFTGMVELTGDEANIANSDRDTVSSVFQFAGEDGSDGDFNDIYASVTWFKKQG